MKKNLHLSVAPSIPSSATNSLLSTSLGCLLENIKRPALSLLVFLFLIGGVGKGWGQLYWGGTTAQSWTITSGTRWGTVEPTYNTTWVSGSAAVFNVANSTITGATTNFSSITSNENVTVSPSGTLGTGGTVATITIASGKTFDFGTQAISTAAGTGFIKAGTGIYATAGGTFTGGFTINAGTVIVRGVNAMGAGGALTINGGIIAANANRDLTGKYTGGITIGGDFTLGATTGLAATAANLIFSNNMALGASSTRIITIGGTGLYTLGGIISGTSSNLSIASTAAGTIVLTNANSYNGLTTVSGGTLHLNRIGGTTLPVTNNVSVTGGTLRISTNQTLNDLTLASGATLTVDAGITLTINGTFNQNGGTISGTGTIAYGSSSTLSYGGSSQTASTTEFPASGVASLTINNSGTVTLSAATDRAISGNLNLMAGTLADNGNTLTVSGNILGTGTHSGAGKILMTGTPKTISGASLGKLELNNAAGFSLTGNPTATSLVLTAGNLTLGANTFTTASATGSALGWVVTDNTGVLKITGVGGTDVPFPVGPASSYNPVVINNSGTIDNFSVKVKTGFDFAPADPTIVVNRQWTVSKDGAQTGNNVMCIYQWSLPGDVGGSFNPAGPMVFGHYTGGSWVELPATYIDPGMNPYTASVSMITDFSPFGVGNAGAFEAACSDAPTLNGPFCPGMPSFVQGQSDEADGTLIKVYVNGVEATTTTVSFGFWGANLNLSAGQSVTATATATGECESAESTAEIVQPQAAPPVITGSYCPGFSETITGTSVEANGSTITLYITNHLPINAVVNSMTWMVSGVELNEGDEIEAYVDAIGKCTSNASNLATVNIRSVEPVINSPICEGGSVVISGTSSEANGTIISLSIHGIPVNPSPVVMGGVWSTTQSVMAGNIIQARATAPGECISFHAIPVTVKAVSNAPSVSSPLCPGLMVTVSGSSSEANGTIIEVYRNGASVGTTSVSGNNWSKTGVSLGGGDLVKATALAPNKCVSPYSATVTVQNSSDAPVVNSPLCEGSMVTVSGSINEANGTIIEIFVGMVSAGTTTSTAGMWSKVVFLPAGQPVTAKATASGECVSPVSNTVFVDPASNAPLVNSPICAGLGVIFGGASNEGNGSLIHIYLNNVFETTVSVTGNAWSSPPTDLIAGDVIKAKAQAPGECQSVFSNTVTVQDKSVPPLITSPICAGATSVSGTSSEANGTTIILYKNFLFAGSTTVTGNAWTVTSLVLADGDVLGATAEAAGECISNFSNLVTVEGDPDQPIIVGSVYTICPGGSSDLSLTGDLNGSDHWQWYSGSCGGTPAGIGTSIMVSPLVTTTYYARGEGGCAANGICGEVTITVTTVSDPPTIDPPLCQGANSFVSGSSSEAPGTTITIFVNNIQRTTTTVGASGFWYTQVSLVLNDQVTATATAAGECESGPSNVMPLGSPSTTPIITSRVCAGTTFISGTSAEEPSAIDVKVNGLFYGFTSTFMGTWNMFGGNPIPGGAIVEVFATGISGCPSAPATIIAEQTDTWTGAVSTDWFDPLNWCGVVPTETVSVTIPAGGNQPVIGAAGALCKDITIDMGASLTMTDPGTITPYGNWTNNGTFNAGTSPVIFATSSTALISAGSSPFYIAEIVFNGQIKLINNQMTVSHELKLTDGSIDLNGNALSAGAISGVANKNIINSSATPVNILAGSENLSTTYNGSILENAGMISVTKTGTGRWVLGASNSTYTGVTQIQDGIIAIGSSPSLTTSGLGANGSGQGTVVSSGASLEIANTATQPSYEPLTLNGTGFTGLGALYGTVAATRAFNGPITLASASTIGGGLTLNGSLSGGQDLTFSGTRKIIFNGSTMVVHDLNLTNMPTSVTFNNTAISITGNLNMVNTPLLGTGLYSFVGTTPQQINGDVEVPLHNMTVTNATGVSLGMSLSVANALLLQSGKLILGNFDATVNSVSTIASNYVVANQTGKLIMQATSGITTTYPVGASLTSYDPVTINPASTSTFSVNVHTTASAMDFTPPINNFSLVAPRQWDVQTGDVPGATELTLTNGDGMYTPAMPYVIGHYNSGTMMWEEFPATYASNTWTLTNYMGTFSPFGGGQEGGFADSCDPPGVNTNPANQAMCATGTSVFFGSFDGDAPITLKWQVQISMMDPFVDINDNMVYSGTDMESLTITSPGTSYDGYKYRLSATNACGGPVYTNDATLDVDPAPTADAGSGTTLGECAGQIYNLDAMTSGTGPSYSWTGAGSIYLDNDAIEDPVFGPAPDDTYTLTLTVTDDYGCMASDDVTITVDPAPTADAGLGTTLGECAGQTYNLDATTSGTVLSYAWTGAGSTYLDNDAIEDPVFGPAPDGSYTLTLTVTDDYGCMASDDVMITVDPILIANCFDDFTVCEDELPIDLYTRTAINGVYSGTGVALGHIFDPSMASGPYIITYTVTDIHGCTNSCTFTITVNDVDGGTIGSDQTICSGGDPAALTSIVDGTGYGSLTYRWEQSMTDCNTDFSAIDNTNSATYDPPSGLTGTTFYRRQTSSLWDAVECVQYSNCVTVTVNDVSGGTIGSNQTVCSGGDPAAFTSIVDGSGYGSISYRWESSTTDCNTDFSAIDNTNSATYDPPSGLTGTTFYRRQTSSLWDAVECVQYSNCVTVTVNDVSGGTIGSNQTICEGGDPAAFTSVVDGTGTGMITYRWESSTTDCNTGFSVIGNTNNATYNPPPGLTQTTYFRRGTGSTQDAVECVQYSNCITVTVNDDEENPTIGCPGDTEIDNDPGICGAVYNYSITYADNCSLPCAGVIPGLVYLGTRNGHGYYRSQDYSDWETAKATATNVGGYLATISSAEENSFLASLIPEPSFIGLTDEITEGTFLWTNGEPLVYSNWREFEPDNDPYYPGGEDQVLLYQSPGGWGDVYGNYSNAYYFIVEFDCLGLEQTAGLPSGSTFPVGDTYNEFLATDVAGNTNTCSFTVTVNDIEDPVVHCSEDITVESASGECGAIVDFCSPNIMYAVSGADNAPSTLYTMDPTTGDILSTIGSTGVSRISAMAINPLTGVIYAHANPFENSNSPCCCGGGQLLTLDPITGAATFVANTTLYVRDMTFRSDGVLYVAAECNYEGDDYRVATLDIVTGAATTLGDFYTSYEAGIAFDKTGKLYLKKYDQLDEISPGDASLIAFHYTDVYTNDILAVGHDNTAYTGNRDGGTFILKSIDLTTGALATIGTNNIGTLSAIAFTPCEGAYATDNCGVGTVTFDPPSGSFFPVGSTEVTVTATDVHGNTGATCTFNVVVEGDGPPSDPVITATESTCQPGCTVGGGFFNITPCVGSAMTFYDDLVGTNPTTTPPAYNQTTPMTIYYACVNTTTGCNSTIQSLTTHPGSCMNPPSPFIVVTNSTCQSPCTPSGGFFGVVGDCGPGTTLTYYTNITGTTVIPAPAYNQTTPMTIYYACVDDVSGCRSMIQSLNTNPGTCTNPAPPLVGALQSTCQPGCVLGGGVFGVIGSCGPGTVLQYYSDISGTMTVPPPLYNQTTPMTIYYACFDLSTGCRSAIQTYTTTPGTCPTPDEPLITETESTCQPVCTVSGGSFNILTTCGPGTTLTYFTDISGTSMLLPPTYNQTTPMTIYYACVSTTTGCRSTVQSLTTNPGTCIQPSSPLITATESTCQPGCTVGGGSFNITPCSGSTMTFYDDGSGTNPTTTPPTYNQTTPMTIYYACVNTVTGCKSATQSLTTYPGTCTDPSSTMITATESTCQPGCTVGGGSFNITPCSGSTMTFYDDMAGSNPTTTPPTYNQTTPMTIYYACVNTTTGCTSAIQSLTTDPGMCTPPEESCPSDVSISITTLPYALIGALPLTGTYSGDGVNAGMFNPFLAGVGPHLITHTSTDDNGCTDFCTFTITVIDDTGLTASNPTPVSEQCIADVPAPDETVVTDEADNCTGSPTVTFVVDENNGGAGCPLDPYVVTRTYRVEDACGNTVDVTQTINVVDTTVPMITGSITPTTVEGCAAGDATAAVSNVAGLVALGLTISDGCTLNANLMVTHSDASTGTCPVVVTRTYFVTDACMNATTAKQIINVNDTTPPTGPSSVAGTSGNNACKVNATTVVPFNAAAMALLYSDNCGGPPTATLTNTKLIGNNCFWILTYTFKVSDPCGNMLLNRTITHTGSDQTAPTGTPPLPSLGNDGCLADATTDFPFNSVIALAGYSDNCGSVSAMTTDTLYTGDECNWGIVYIFKVVDQCGNALTNQQMIIGGSDQTPPTFTRPPDIQIYSDGMCVYDADPSNAGDVTNESDNCSVGLEATYTDNVVPGPCDCSQIITRTWSLVDDCGNPAPDQIQTILVTSNMVMNNLDDGSIGSLRYVISCIAPGGTVIFPPGMMGATIVLTSGEIMIDKDLTIIGLGKNNLTISGNNASRIFHVAPGFSFELDSLTLIDATSVTNGGAVYTEGNLILDNVRIQNCTEGLVPVPRAWTASAIPPATVTIRGNVEIKE